VEAKGSIGNLLTLWKGGYVMGIWKDLFGDSKNNSREDYAPTRNSAERQASADYMSESLSTGRDPIPKDPPDWAKDIPGPKDSSSNK
jgi:hypothetical protein